MFKFKLVKFNDGRYAARRWFFGYDYMDIDNPCKYDWSKAEHVDKWCKGTREVVEKAINTYYDKGTPV